jgi:hypothetical protein
MRMELNRPVTEEQHKQADEKHREVVRSQKSYIRELADKLEAGETLDAFAREFAAAVLRGAANNMSEVRKRPKGQSKVQDEVAVYVASDVVFEGKSKNASMEHWAGVYDVDVASIKKVLNKVGYESIKKSMENSRDKKDGETGIKWISKADT